VAISDLVFQIKKRQARQISHTPHECSAAIGRPWIPNIGQRDVDNLLRGHSDRDVLGI
jgi:hypothetical protein